MPIVETRDLWQKRDGRDILKSINLRVERGEVFALIGPTGAGKTTLLRLIDMLDTPAAGKIIFDGTDANASEKVRLEMRRRMAFVLQKPVVFNATVYDNIACGLKWRGLGRSSIHEKTSSILEIIGLSDYKDRNARTLSGGEVQRVAIARAMATEPEILLMDEPTANLDPVSASKIERLITEIIKKRVVTVIMATHDMVQGQRLADRIGVLIDGKIVQTGTYRDVFTSPESRSVAEFVGIENVIDGVVLSSEEGVITIDIQGKKVGAISDYAVGEEVSACIRPEDVILSLSEVSSSARNSFVGQVLRLVSIGPLARIEVDCGFPVVSLITKRSAEELALEKGKHVYAAFKATAVHVIRRN
jgi:tungstate transport system ATP-binding protein